MEHLFITRADVYSPRWREAFNAVHILEQGEKKPIASSDMLGWVLLDGEDNLELLGEYLQQRMKVVAMTRNENPVQAKRLIAAGASGYIHYLAAPLLLQQVAQVVQMGGVWVGADLMRQLMTAAAQEQPPLSSAKLGLLTPREKAVAEAVAVGKTNKEVARLLDITERTVKAHLGAIFEKLDVRDRLQLVLCLGNDNRSL